jgi:uncharacterized RDD family membrane protein YckC
MANLSSAIAKKSNIKSETTEIFIKPTSPTLIDFPNKPIVAELPEWRLKLQNAVRTRKENVESNLDSSVITKHRKINLKRASGFKAELYEKVEPTKSVNPVLERALQRIEKSKNLCANIEPETPKFEQPIPKFEVKPVLAKTYQFTLPKTRIENPLAEKVEEKLPIEEKIIEKPKPREEVKPVKTKHLGTFNESDNLDTFLDKAKKITEEKPVIEKYKTNKLPPLSEKISASFGKIRDVFSFSQADSQPLTQPHVEIRTFDATKQTSVEEIDDIPPLSARLTAGIFDFLIGGFLSLILLSPFMLMGGQWFGLEGLFGFVATCAIVMFIYLTTSIGLLGKTIGMIIFQLEMVDIESNDLPSFHQAAVSSSVYLLSIVLGGIGFLTMYLNSEQRAAHDLLSNTIIVREI